MQVSQIAELDSHAVIGGGEAKAFGMSNSAEFFTILSDTLYRDKKLAVVREVICNAHDAHVMGKCLDRPIEITLDEKELVIKDFGPGISDEKMHPVYCIYGGSTKVDDATQIGGFGLGCKAPFAYSDHFTVISCHDGVRSVYAISRGGLESDGKPALRKMVSVPTDQTGIIVSVPIKKRDDAVEFNRLIRQVVRNGDINVTLNGEKLPRFNFAGIEKSKYALADASELHESMVYVRLGSVLYPVTSDHAKLSELVRVFKNNDGLRLIVLAQSGEIGITPSREALSNSETTINFLIERLTKIQKDLCHRMPKAMTWLAQTHVDKTTGPTVSTQFTRSSCPRGIGLATDPDEIARRILIVAMDNPWGRVLGVFRDKAGQFDKAVLKAAARKYPQHRRVFRRALKFDIETLERYHTSNGWHGDVGQLLIRLASRLNIMKHVYRYGYRYTKRYDDIVKDGGSSVVLLSRNISGFNCKPTIVLMRSREQAVDFVSVKTHQTANGYAFIAVRTLKPEKIAEIKNTFIKHGFKIEELDIAKPAPKPRAPKLEPVKETFLPIEAAGEYGRITSNVNRIEFAPIFIECGTLNDDFYPRLTGAKELIRKDRREVLKTLYPEIALAIGAQEKRALIKAGSKDFKEVFVKEFLELQTTPETLFVVAAQRGRLFSHKSSGDLETILANKLAMSDLRYAKLLCGQRTIVTKEEQRTLNLLEVCSKRAGLDTVEKLWSHCYVLNRASEKIIKKIDLDYLKALSGIYNHGGYGDIPWSEDLVEVLRHLQRRAVRTKATEQPLKEAA